MSHPVACLLQTRHVDCPSWLGGSWFGSHNHSMTAHCWRVGRQFFDDSKLNVSFNVFFHLFSPMQRDSEWLCVADKLSIWFNCQLYRRPCHSFRFLVCTAVESARSIITQQPFLEPLSALFCFDYRERSCAWWRWGYRSCWAPTRC